MRIMGNLYTDNLIGTVIGLSVADDWEGARREWEIVGCEVDETHSATCVCGKEGLRYVYTIANTETGETLSFRPTKYNGYDGYNDYLFLLDMFNGGFCSEAQERKCQAIIMQSIYPWLRNLWKKSKSQKGKIDNGK